MNIREIMTSFCCVGVLITALPLTASEVVNAADDTSQEVPLKTLFPQSGQIAGWRRKDDPVLYVGNQIFKYMDGAGEIPLGYGFRRLATARYSKSGAVVEVVVFEMNDSNAAFGYYTVRDRSSDERFVELDHRARLIPGFALIAWKGHYTVIVSVEEADVADGVLLQFASAVLSRLKKKGASPDLLRYLLKEGRVENSERYIRGKATFDAEVKFIMADVFGLRGDVEAAVAEYRIQKGECDLTLLRYQSQRAAAKAWEAFTGYLKNAAGVVSSSTCIAHDPPDGFVGAFHHGQFVGVVLRAKDEEAAKWILKRFKDFLTEVRN